VQEHVVVNEAAGIRPNDVGWLRVALFTSYYSEQDYAGLSAAAAAQLTNSVPGELAWLAAKVFHGLALSRQTPPQPGAAVAAREEVMAYGCQNQADHDAMILAAARWRVHLALTTGDKAKVLEMIRWVEQGNGEVEVKTHFLRDHAAVAAWLVRKRG